MADQTLDVVMENENAAVGCQFERSMPFEEELKEHRDSISTSDYSDDTPLSSTDEEPKLPILKKIDVMEAKIKRLKKEHTNLSKEVKDITSNKFPGSEVFNTLHQICAEHELMKKQHAEESQVLKKKYFEEYAERKRLYNEVIELKGNIRVFCRCRPLNRDEITSGCTSHVEFDSSQENKLQITCADSSKKEFKFDHVFGPEDNQEAIFSQTSPIVTSVLDGYNVCIFAYGQTGTGKTFTMEGTSENRGVNYRTLEELFKISNERSNTMRYKLFVSMLEVYNEKIRDLLAENSSNPTQKLEIKQAADGTQEVPGLVEVSVSSTNEVWEILKRGNLARSIGSTNANEYSSRSHCLLRVTVKGEGLVNNMRTKSNLWLVDLAGSERVGKTEAEGERLKESQFINKSLSALGDVISALASKATHVPFRNSKLTHILQSSLGGDCKTLMFVQISPSSSDLGETLCSLNFASRVRGIEYGPAQKHVDHSELLKYKQMAEKVKHDEKEMKKLQDSVQSLQLRLSAKDHVVRSLQDKVRCLENQLGQQVVLKASKPPLGAFKLRSPLRQLNSLPNPRQFSQIQSNKLKENSSMGTTHTGQMMMQPRRATIALRPSSQSSKGQMMNSQPQPNKFRPSTFTNKENSSVSATHGQMMMQPRRLTIALKPSSSQSLKGQMIMQPRRRVSVATTSMQDRTPLRSITENAAKKRESIFKDPVRFKRYSKLFSPTRSVMTATPMSVNKSISRFAVSPPPTQVGSWKPKHPTVIALQKKHVLWSPRKFKALNNKTQRQSSIFP